MFWTGGSLSANKRILSIHLRNTSTFSHIRTHSQVAVSGECWRTIWLSLRSPRLISACSSAQPATPRLPSLISGDHRRQPFGPRRGRFRACEEVEPRCDRLCKRAGLVIGKIELHNSVDIGSETRCDFQTLDCRSATRREGLQRAGEGCSLRDRQFGCARAAMVRPAMNYRDLAGRLLRLHAGFTSRVLPGSIFSATPPSLGNGSCCSIPLKKCS